MVAFKRKMSRDKGLTTDTPRSPASQETVLPVFFPSSHRTNERPETLSVQGFPVFPRYTETKFWRRGRDLNPGYRFKPVYALSRRAPSANSDTSPTLRTYSVGTVLYSKEECLSREYRHERGQTYPGWAQDPVFMVIPSESVHHCKSTPLPPCAYWDMRLKRDGSFWRLP